MTNIPTIDACVHHGWAKQDELMEYMGRGWREYLNQPKLLPGVGVDEPPIAAVPFFPYRRSQGDTVAGSSPDGAPAGTSLDVVQEQLLDANGVERAVLAYDIGRNIPSAPNTHLARELARAANDWTIDRWIEEDERF